MQIVGKIYVIYRSCAAIHTYRYITLIFCAYIFLLTKNEQLSIDVKLNYKVNVYTDTLVKPKQNTSNAMKQIISFPLDMVRKLYNCVYPKQRNRKKNFGRNVTNICTCISALHCCELLVCLQMDRIDQMQTFIVMNTREIHSTTALNNENYG